MVKNVKIGLLAITFVFVAAILGQFYSNTKVNAANTLSGTNEIINIATTDGQPMDKGAGMIGVSGDGNVILFRTKATNVPNAGGGGYSGTGGLYTYDSVTDVTTRMDISANGTLPDATNTGGTISDNGRYVYFISRATNLIDGTYHYPTQTYIRDLQAGTITAVSNHYWANASDTIDYPIGISDDGRFVLLTTRYVGLSTSNFYNLMLGDRQSGSFTWTSLAQASGVTYVEGLHRADFSCDGSFAVYQKTGFIYLADLRRGGVVTSLIGPGGQSDFPTISCDGTYVTYTTKNRTDVSPTPVGMSSNSTHLVRYNRITGEYKYIDSNSSGQFNNNIIPKEVSIADTGDVVMNYSDVYYVKHLSDRSDTLESVAKDSSGNYINVSGPTLLTNDSRFILFSAEPFDLGLTPSPVTRQIIRTKSGI